MVRLCSSGALFVKLIATLPDLALSEVVSYFSCPSGLAATLSAAPELVPPVGEVDVEVVGVAAGAGSEVLVLFDELPHPARMSAPSTISGMAGFTAVDLTFSS